MASRFFLFFIFLLKFEAQAQLLPQNFSIEGRLFDSVGVAINSTADIRLEVLVQGDSNGCVFYRDDYTNIDLSSTDPDSRGVFSLRLGASGSVYMSTSISNLGQLFSTTTLIGDINGDGVQNPIDDSLCSAVSAPAGTPRTVRVSVRTPSGSGSYVALSPNTVLTSTATALVADTLRGKLPTDFVQIPSSGSSLTQANAENIFSTTNYTALTALIGGTSTLYMRSSPTAAVNFNNQRLTSVATPTAASDAATKGYADANLGGKSVDTTSTAALSGVVGDGFVLSWDTTTQTWQAAALPAMTDATKLPLAGGTMSGAITMAGYDIYNTGHITMGNGRYLHLGNFTNAGEAALAAADNGKIWFNTDRGSIRFYDGAGARTLYEVSPGHGLVGVIASGLITINVDTGTTANKIMQLDSAARIPAVDGGLVSNVNAVKLQGQIVSADLPSSGFALKWNGSQWEPQADNNSGGDITDVVAGVGATGGGTVGMVTIGVNVGTGANQIVQLDTLSRIPALDGGLLLNMNAARLQGRAVASSAPSTNDILKWNGSEWVPSADVDTGITTISGDVVATGSGAVVATISNNAITSGKINSLSANLGVNRLLITDSSTGSNVDYAVCGNNQVLKFLTGTGWSCASDENAGGDITEVSTGLGLLGGGSSGALTLSVNAGVGANQLVQLDSSARLPALDAGLLTNVNAEKLQARSIASIAPIANQILKWNDINSQWQPENDNDAGGDITSITAGNGLSGGGTSLAVTVSVNTAQVAMIGGNSNAAAMNLGTGDGQSLNLITSGTPKLSIEPSGNLSVDGTSFFVDATNNRVGVGTTSPSWRLHVSNTLTSTSGTQYTIFNNATYANSTISNANIYGIRNSLNQNGTSAWSAAKVVGSSNYVQDSSTSALAGSLYGGESVADVTSTSVGANVQVVGHEGVARLNPGSGSHSVTKAIGLRGSVERSATGTGAIGLAIGVESEVTDLGPLIDVSMGFSASGVRALRTGAESYGMYINDIEANTTSYGIFIGAQAGTYRYGIYQNEQDSENILAGPATIGESVSPTPGAVLELRSNSVKNASTLLIPRDTNAMRPVNSVPGMIRYNTSNNKFEAYEGSPGDWVNMIGGGAAGAGGSNTQVQFNSGGTLTGSSNFVWDNTTRVLNVSGHVKIGNNSVACNAGNAGLTRFNTGNVANIAGGTTAVNAMEVCNGADWVGTSGITNCPSGFAIVGKPGTPGAFCIDASARTTVGYVNAEVGCAAVDSTNPSIGRAHLCTNYEWRQACLGGVLLDFNQIIWIASTLHTVTAITYANTMTSSGVSCAATPQIANAVAGSLNYRCCIK